MLCLRYIFVLRQIQVIIYVASVTLMLMLHIRHFVLHPADIDFKTCSEITFLPVSKRIKTDLNCKQKKYKKKWKKNWKWSQNSEESTQTKRKTYTKPFKRLSLSGEHNNKHQFTIIIVSSTFSVKTRT